MRPEDYRRSPASPMSTTERRGFRARPASGAENEPDGRMFGRLVDEGRIPSRRRSKNIPERVCVVVACMVHVSKEEEEEEDERRRVTDSARASLTERNET